MENQVKYFISESLRKFHQGNFLEAKRRLDQVLNIDSKNPSALELLGVICGLLRNYSEALVYFEKLTQINPKNPVLWFNLGKVFKELKRYDEAQAAYGESINLKSNDHETWSNQGNVFFEIRHFDQALACHEQAIKIKPDYAEAWCNRGSTLSELQRFDEALTSLNKALKFKPNYVDALYNQDIVLYDIDEYEPALHSFEKALQIKPGHVGSLANRGRVLLKMGYFARAQTSFYDAEKYVQDDPNPERIRSTILFNLNYMEFSNYEIVRHHAQLFGSAISNQCRRKFTTWNLILNPKKLRIGFLSGDIRSHSVGFFLQGLVEHLNQDQFELYALPTNSKSDELSDRLRPFFKEWLPIHAMSDEEVAKLIHQDADNRLPVFAYKPAPIQATWLGLPMTTGVNEIDFLIADPYALPPEFEIHITEAVWRLPDTYICMKPPQHIGRH